MAFIQAPNHLLAILTELFVFIGVWMCYRRYFGIYQRLKFVASVKETCSPPSHFPSSSLKEKKWLTWQVLWIFAVSLQLNLFCLKLFVLRSWNSSTHNQIPAPPPPPSLWPWLVQHFMLLFCFHVSWCTIFTSCSISWPTFSNDSNTWLMFLNYVGEDF